jgi:hypothetical protein
MELPIDVDEEDWETKEEPLAPEVAIMTTVLRFLQLLCENHNSEMQVRFDSYTNYKMKVKIYTRKLFSRIVELSSQSRIKSKR